MKPRQVHLVLKNETKTGTFGTYKVQTKLRAFRDDEVKPRQIGTVHLLLEVKPRYFAVLLK